MPLETIKQTQALDDEFSSHLRLVEPDDAAFICELRSDPSLNRHISPSSPDVAAQRAWIEGYKLREAAGQEFYFVIRHNMKDFGVVRMYDFHPAKGSFSWGSWIIKPSRPTGLVTFSARMIYELGFDALGFEQSHFDVRNGNAKVLDFHVRSGARHVGGDEIDRLFVFDKSAWPAFAAASEGQMRQHRICHG